MRIVLTKTFHSDYQKLPETIRKKVDRQLRSLTVDIRHPSLRVKKMKGAPGIWEALVDRFYRLTFTVREGSLYLRRVGPHDAALKKR